MTANSGLLDEELYNEEVRCWKWTRGRRREGRGRGEGGGGGVFQRDLIDDQHPCLILLLFLKHYHLGERKDFPNVEILQRILNDGQSFMFHKRIIPFFSMGRKNFSFLFKTNRWKASSAIRAHKEKCMHRLVFFAQTWKENCKNLLSRSWIWGN